MKKEKNKILKFPEGFLWGAATSAHQVEGGNKNDWTGWEKKNAKRLAKEAKTKWATWQQEKFPEMFDPKNYVSGRACDHYKRYEEDLDIAKSLNLSAFRISIEWSRIEPKEGKFDEKEIKHYRKVIKAIRARGMEPFVTLWHYTLPIWLVEKKGILNKKFPEYFARYSQYIAKNLNDLCEFWVTLNEPSVVISHSYIEGIRPPQKKNLWLAWRAYRRIMRAHNLSYKSIKEASEKNQVGFANHIKYFKPYKKNSVLDNLAVWVAGYFGNWIFYGLSKNKNDFIALQYYFRFRLKFPRRMINENKDFTDLGWEIFPEGIYYLLKEIDERYSVPIYILENGIADADDIKRKKFVKDHLQFVYAAIRHGVDVRGYFHWSLLDNFEWDKGFWPRFGLVEVDYKTLERKIRPSAREYAKICKNNSLVL
ncbi:MAG: glycoside hydrolase family 1 protein [Candidatus Moranbacteria bacterium]|nr:glycoside hydrolase family 1 protein [Candidatus Moranbacteria bacterium]